MGEHDVLGDGEAQSGAARFAGAGFVDAIEALEQARQMFGSDAGAEVANVELDTVIGSTRAQYDALARASVFHSVLDEIRKDLVDGFAVCIDGGVDDFLNGEFHALTASDVMKTLDRVVEKFGGGGGLD